MTFNLNFQGSEKNRKRDLNAYYRAADRDDIRAASNLPGRGDIPIIHGDCDGNRQKALESFKNSKYFRFFSENLLRGINDLIALVKKLQQDIANQHADIKRLQSLIENCAACQEPQNLRRVDTCQYANPCFPGEWILVICP